MKSIFETPRLQTGLLTDEEFGEMMKFIVETGNLNAPAQQGVTMYLDYLINVVKTEEALNVAEKLINSNEPIGAYLNQTHVQN